MSWAAVFSAGVCALAALGVPSLIRRVPEPEPAENGEEKMAYADIAALPRLTPTAALVGALVGLALGWALGWSWDLLVVLPLVPIGIALSTIDWHTRLLPTWIIAPSYALVILCILGAAAAQRDLWPVERAGLGWALAGGFFWLLWWFLPSGMGYGDVRLSGVLGLALGFLGWGELALGIWAGFLLGGVIGAVLSLARRVRRERYPFGPFMLAGAVVGVLWGGGFLLLG